MRLLDVLNAPWAIAPAKLEEIRAIYATHLRGEKIDLAGIEAKIGGPLQRKEQGYEVDRGVAIVPIQGVMAKKANLFMQISGGSSTELVARDLREAAADPNVASILLDVDSPGGTVAGTQTLADIVREVGAQKTVVAMVNGTAASAAYWVASAADSIYATERAAEIGSIGVVATHIDKSEALAKEGVRVTEITAGRYKRAASQYAPLSDEGRDTIQAQVDALYTLFVDAVADQRGTTSDKVLADMADGRVFFAPEAISRGMIDGIMSRDELITQMAMSRLPTKRRSAAGAPSPVASSAGDALPTTLATEPVMEITADTIRAEHPDIADAFRAQERERILGIEAQAIPGHEALIAEMKADGKTTPEQAAVRILGAEKAARASALQAITDQAPEPAKASTAPADKPLSKDEKAARARAHADKAFGGDFLAAYKDLFGND